MPKLQHGRDERDTRARMAGLGRAADRVCRLIMNTDLPAVDILIERQKVRALCEQRFPGRVELYDMVYESRFDRLWDQFRVEK